MGVDESEENVDDVEGTLGDGTPVTTRRWVDPLGIPSRVGGPAVVCTRKDGTVAREEYLREGDRHRIDGPAVVTYWPDGEVNQEQWWLDDDCYLDHAELIESFLSASVYGFEDDVEKSGYAVFISDYGFEPIRAALEGGVVTVDGVRQVLEGAPVEWVRAYEEGHP